MKIIVHRTGLFPALIAVVLAVFSAGCNDGPSDIGNSYLQQNVVFHTLTILPEQIRIFSGVAAANNSSLSGGYAILVGQASDGSVAHSLLGYTGLNPLVTGPTAKTITSAELRLRTAGYRYGDTASRRATFDVVVIDQSFPSTTQWSDTTVGRITGAGSIGSFTVSYPDSSVISVSLDAAAISQFFQTYYRNDTTLTTVNNQPDTIISRVILKSLALRARSDASMIGSFVGPGFAGVNDSLKATIRLKLSDTTVDIRPDISTWIANSPAPRGAGIITAMAGMPVRTSFQFSIDSIPPSATIHQATLRLHVDTLNSPHGSSGPVKSLIAYLAADSSLHSPGSFLVSVSLGFFLASRAALDSARFSDEFQFTSLAPAITQWQRYGRSAGGIPNLGIILGLNRTSSAVLVENVTMDRLRFFGLEAADPSKRPSLTIVYSTQKDK